MSGATSSAGVSSTVTASCTFDVAARRGTCIFEYSGSRGVSTTTTSVASYESVADFIDEVAVVPRDLDVNGNLTRQVATGGGSADTTIYTTTATAQVCP